MPILDSISINGIYNIQVTTNLVKIIIHFKTLKYSKITKIPLLNQWLKYP